MLPSSSVSLFISVALIGFAVAACDNPSPVSSAPSPATSTNLSIAEDTSSSPQVAKVVAGKTEVAWGPNDARVTLVLDRDTKKAMLSVLQSDGVTPLSVPTEKIYLTIDAPLTEIELIADPQGADTPGAASCFTAVHEVFNLTKPLSGTISAKIDNDPYVSDFAEPYDLFASQSK